MAEPITTMTPASHQRRRPSAVSCCGRSALSAAPVDFDIDTGREGLSLTRRSLRAGARDAGPCVAGRRGTAVTVGRVSEREQPPGPGEGRDAAPGDDTAGNQPDAPAEPPFDPYRFGRPEHPVPPEYAPPGYVPDPPPQPGPPPPAPPYGAPPYGAPPPGQAGPPYAGGPGYPHYPGGPGPYAGGPPGYPGGYGPPPPARGGSNGKAITALVLGALSIVLCWLSLFDVVLIVPAIVFGSVGLSESRRSGSGRRLAIGGIACAVIGAVLAVFLTVLVKDAFDQCGGISHRNDPGFMECVQNEIT